MKRHAQIRPEDLDRRGLHLTIFAGLAVFVLAAGVAILMYEAVFSPTATPVIGTPRTPFYGFCILSVLLVSYIWERQITIVKLRNQIAGDRKKASMAQELASRELLKTLPNFGSLQDRLPMEFRRAATTSQAISILVVEIDPHQDFSAPSAIQCILGDSAKAIARKLHEEDSLYLLQSCYFAIVLPGATLPSGRGMAARISECLEDVAGTMARFAFKIDVVNYPEHASTAIELESSVCALISDENSREPTVISRLTM
jgi:GGDEF domain-containing protein